MIMTGIKFGRCSMTCCRLAACALFALASLRGQTITGSISGTVSDQSSSPVQGATVTLNHPATGSQRETQTDGRSDFVFSGLAPGEYSLTVRQRGFKTVERSGIVLSASERLSIGQVVLVVGEVTEKVTVSAEAAVVQ